MDSEVIERVQSISLTEVEGKTIALNPSRRTQTLDDCSLSLVGRFLTTRDVNHRAAKNLLRSAWKLGNDLRIVDVGEGLYLFRFKLESQLQWVQDSSPWSFDNHLLMMRRWKIGIAAHNMVFTHVPLWVQVWGLPFDLMTEETFRDIRSELGTMLMVKSKPIESDQARFLQIRINIPLNQPLRRESPVTNPEGDRFVVAFKYERLVGLCYTCRHLGHEKKNCTLHDPSPEQQPNP